VWLVWLASEGRTVMPTLSDKLNNVHCIIQELERAGVDLPMGDYEYIYDVLEEARDKESEGCND